MLVEAPMASPSNELTAELALHLADLLVPIPMPMKTRPLSPPLKPRSSSHMIGKASKRAYCVAIVCQQGLATVCAILAYQQAVDNAQIQGDEHEYRLQTEHDEGSDQVLGDQTLERGVLLFNRRKELLVGIFLSQSLRL